jgi:hypothetical protein
MFVISQEKEEVVAAKKHNITLLLGDWGGDGHEKTCEFNYVFNKSKDEIFDAYKKGAEKVGFDFINTVAVDYEDSYIEDAIYEKLKKVGAMEELTWEDYAEQCRKTGDKMRIDRDDYVKIFLFIVTLGDPFIEYTEVKREIMDIGGYGFFY